MEHIKSFKLFEKETKYTTYDNSKGGKFWGDQGAGILPICKNTGRLLVSFRSKEVNEPHTWGIFGGKMDTDETPMESAKRELIEETGYEGNFELIPAYVYISPNEDFKYHNFIGIVETEFEPEYDWETESSKWLSMSELLELKPKHFGLKKLLDKSIDIIKQFAK